VTDQFSSTGRNEMQPEATTSFRSVLRNYIKAEPEKKAKYILGNFAVFISIVDSCEHSLKRTIKAERRYNRKSALGDVGIRVQNSHTVIRMRDSSWTAATFPERTYATWTAWTMIS
jgi:hypothetical protein